MLKLKISKLSILFSFLLLSIACSFDVDQKVIKDDNNKPSTWEEIKKRGKLIAVTEYTSTNYFIYKGQPMGYQYELLKKLAKSLNLELEIVLSNDLDDSFAMLKDGEYDLMAIDLTITKEREKNIDFTNPISQTRQILVQKKPEGWESMKFKEYDAKMIRSSFDLAQKRVYVKSNTAFYDRLSELSKEIKDTIYITDMEMYSTEEIIALVASGDIEYTVCDEHIAKVNSKYYPNIDIKTNISYYQNLAWGVQKGSDSLRYHINQFFEKSSNKRWFANLYNKYYKNSRSAGYFKSDYLSLNGSNISRYDKIIKKYGAQINWDWRLLASIIFQESRFNPEVQSWAGAEGLMQLIPTTAERFGVHDLSNPSENIKAGTGFIMWLEKQLYKTVPDSTERVNFILASYNVGLGHILDAIRLAKKNGKDTAVWKDNVDYYLLHKSNPKFYNDPVVKYGYCRGSEPYKYVNEVMNRYAEYRKVLHE